MKGPLSSGPLAFGEWNQLGFAPRKAERVLDILGSEDALEIFWVLIKISYARRTGSIPAVEE